MYTYETLHNLILMGNAVGIPSFVRVPQLARGDVSRSLDCGAAGVMVPMIESKKQAELLVEWSKYPPIGNRGYAGGANTNYRPSGNHKNNMIELNESVISIAQIETDLGVKNIEEIISVEGIDAAIVGPSDLAISLGIPGDYFNQIEIEAIDKVAAACFIKNIVYDDYDRLIQLCDAISLQNGACIMEKRLIDVALRHGLPDFTIDKWKAFLELKNYFDKLCDCNIYTLLPNVIENSYESLL